MNKLKLVPMYVFVIITSIFSIFPFLWMIISATNSSTDVVKGKLTLGLELGNNFMKLTKLMNLPQVMGNTLIIAVITTILTLVIASMAGYGFEMYSNKWREKMFGFFLLTMMVPFAAIMIPLFKIFSKLGLLNSFAAVILPSLASVFIVFYFRQSTKTFQKELIQAARVDGLNEFQAFLYIFVPSMKSTYAAAAIIVFMSTWNSFMWPLIVLQSNNKKTMTLAISSISSSYTPDFGVIMTAIIIATLPTLFIFFAMQKQFVAGMLGSVK